MGLVFTKLSGLPLKKWFLVAGILVAIIGPSYYFYNRYTQTLSLLKQAGNSPDEAREILEKARRHILMPQGEVPTILTVTDTQKVSGQEFYKNAKNGDKVIVFYQAKKAYLYDALADIILEVGPVLATGSAASTLGQSPAATPTIAPVRVVLYNGTAVVGLTRRFETKLLGKVANVSVVDRVNAASSDYKESILIDVSGSNPRAGELATSFGLRLEPLPSGEKKPEQADILIILGRDQE